MGISSVASPYTVVDQSIFVLLSKADKSGNSPPDDSASYTVDDFDAYTDTATAHIFGAFSAPNSNNDEKAPEA